MSQHYYQTTNHQGEAVRVLAGWDRPLGHFFLTVAYHDAADRDEDGPIYSNLDDPQGGLAHLESFAYYREVLTELGIDVPGAMIEAIEQDMAQGVGNRYEDWTKARA